MLLCSQNRIFRIAPAFVMCAVFFKPSRACWDQCALATWGLAFAQAMTLRWEAPDDDGSSAAMELRKCPGVEILWLGVFRERCEHVFGQANEDRYS